MISSREPEKLAEFAVEQNARVRRGTFKEAATFGELDIRVGSWDHALKMLTK